MQSTATAHPNIALVKYWGKADLPGNVPAVPSLSLTLGGLATQTRVTLTDAPDALTFNDEPRADARIGACIDRFRAAADYTGGVRIDTRNDFPTAAGLASSASGFAALVAALNDVFALGYSADRLSVEARRASASAARSIHGGIVSLRGDDDPDTWQGRVLAAADDWPLAVVVAICATDAKDRSSRDGMQISAATSPYYDRWVATANADYEAADAAIRTRDFAALAKVSESSCLKMHAVMMSSEPALLYWNSATHGCLDVIRTLQHDGVPVFFTIDAGPQVKAVCLPAAAEQVADALGHSPGVSRVIRSGIGGPVTVSQGSVSQEGSITHDADTHAAPGRDRSR